MSNFKVGKEYLIRLAVSAVACFVTATAIAAFGAARISRASENKSFVDNRIYKGNWSYPDEKYIVALDSGYMTFENSSDGYTATYFDSSFKYKSEKKISKELSKFGAFYSDSNGYYVFTGQDNTEESSSVECYRLTKYDKNWNRIGSCGLKDCNTYEPFFGGSADITSSGNYLVIRTCHTMYRSDDGYTHQANVTILVNTSTMKILDSKYTVAYPGYCSHSFNQYVRIDNNRIIGADHGDAYPRVMGIWSYNTDITTGKIGTSTTAYQPFVIGGSYDDNANYTGATLGGLEISSSSYILVGSSIDQNDYSTKGKNIYVSTVNKSSGSMSTKWLTTDADSNTTSYDNPFIVKLSSTSFAVIWSRDSKVYYAFIDGNGNIQGKVKSAEGLLSDCQPILTGNKILWYTNNKTTNFYYINTSDQSFHVSRDYLVNLAKPSNGTATLSKTKAYAGETITVSVYPAEGYELDKIEVNGTPLENSYEFTLDECDTTVTVTFKKIMYKVTVNTPEGGTVKLSATEAGKGTRITVTCYADAGYLLDSITVNKTALTVNQTVVSSGYFYMEACDADIVVSFMKKVYTVSLGSVSNGSATLSTASASIGDEVTVNVEPNDGYEFDYIWVSGTKYTETHFTMGSSDVTVYVYFKRIQYKVNVTASEGGKATATSETAYPGYTVGINYTPSDGYQLDTITVNGTAITGRTFTMGTGVADVVVTFRKIPYTVSLNPTTNGTAKLSATSAYVGDKVTVDATPAKGYELDAILVNGDAISGNSFTMKAANTKVTVSFKKITYKIKVNETADGKVTVLPASASIGDRVTVKADPADGYELDTIKVNGTAINGMTFTMEEADTTVDVSFKKLPEYSITVKTVSEGTAKVSKDMAYKGEKITVTATPAEGYELESIKVNGKVLSGTVFTMTAEDTTVEVTFTNEHKLTEIPGKAATCTEDGYKESYECSRCHKLFSDAEGKHEIKKTETIPALGHDPKPVKGKRATRDNDGNKGHYVCSRCGKKFWDKACKRPADDKEIVIPAIGAAKLGEKATVKGLIYKVTNPSTNGSGTVSLIGVKEQAENVTIPSTVVIKETTYKVDLVGAEAFSGNKALKSVVIGENVLTIDSKAFYGCSSLTSVTGGDNLVTIGTSAFAGCKKFKTFKITSPVLAKIGSSAFSGDKKLKTVYIKNTTKLTKSGVKKSLKGSKVKTVKVKKSKVKAYKKIFKKKNSGRTVKVKK